MIRHANCPCTKTTLALAVTFAVASAIGPGFSLDIKTSRKIRLQPRDMFSDQLRGNPMGSLPTKIRVKPSPLEKIPQPSLCPYLQDKRNVPISYAPFRKINIEIKNNGPGPAPGLCI
jgi:hypothetical protein